MRSRLVVVFLLFAAAHAAVSQTPYKEPPPEIVRLVDAPPLPYVDAGPRGDVLLLLHRESLPPISEMARPMLRLAGTRIDPGTNARHGPRSVVGITIHDLTDGGERRVSLPDDVGVGFPSWSPDGTRFAFTVTTSDGVALWLGDVAGGEARALTGARLNTLGVSPRWLPDGSGLVVGLIPEGRGPAPERSPVPLGPVVQESEGGDAAPVRTYQDLLSDPHDEALFDHFFTSQLALVTLDGETRPIGEPAVFVNADPAPGGAYLLVERLQRPYSYLVPWYRFPQTVEVWDVEGRLVKPLATLPLAERVPIEGVITGPRGHTWRATAGTADITWIEALDGGDPNRDAAQRDKLMLWSAPFDGAPVELARLEDRYSSLSWLGDEDRALLTEYDRDERWARTWIVATDGEDGPRLLFDRSVRDQYGDPGRPVTHPNSAGRGVVRVDDGRVLLNGRGSSPEGDRPFLDALELASLETTRLWRCEGEQYEAVSAILSTDGPRVLTRYETPVDPPNYGLRDLGAGGERVAVTHFEHPAPELLGIHKEMVTYERGDGVTLSATLYLPADHEPGQRHPLLVWAYPREYNDAKTAGQVRGSPYRFTMFGGSSHLALLTQGYAVMDAATMPVVGDDPETVNDSFIAQIVAAARAAIDKAADMGVADPERVGVGGHSYGAFMTANLLAHSDLFRAGLARSGAYNRTLTPFGFQAERRTFWEAPDIYFALSPFMHADKIDEPLLMIHGMEDNNSGTFPIQSERMYHAVKGHGGVTRLVMLPEESHGYRARESVLHTQAEMLEWMDRWVRPARPAE